MPTDTADSWFTYEPQYDEGDSVYSANKLTPDQIADNINVITDNIVRFRKNAMGPVSFDDSEPTTRRAA